MSIKIIKPEIYISAVSDLSENSNFYRTVINPVSDLTVVAQLGKLNLQEVFLWGITELSTSTFSKIPDGSVILFYHQGYIIGYSTVIGKFSDKSLSITLWGSFLHGVNKELCSWANILILTAFSKVKVDFKNIITIGHYSEKFAPRRIIKLNDDAQTFLANSEITIEEFLSQYNLKNV